MNMNMNMNIQGSTPKQKNFYYILGKAILYASIQFAIGSVEMSSKFSVRNFSTNQQVLDNAVIALRDYIIIGLLWTFGTSLIFLVNYGLKGLVLNVIVNLFIILWIYFSYQVAFEKTGKQSNLQVKSIFTV